MNQKTSPQNSKQTSHYAAYGWIVCSLAAIFYCYEYLLRIEPSVMMDPLMRHFQVTAVSLGVISAMYYFAYTPLQAVVGVITDYLGSRKALAIAIGFCVIGSYVFGATASIYWAAFGRFLIGAGSAFAFVCVLKLAAVWLPQRFFALFVGITTALGMLGAMLGDVGMSWFVQHVGWHEVVIFCSIFGALLIPAFLIIIKDGSDNSSSSKDSFFSDVLELFKLFLNRQLILAGIIGCLLYLSLAVFGEMWGVPFLTGISQYSKITASELNSMVFLGWLIGSPLSGWISDRFRTRRLPLIVGSLVTALVFLIILIYPQMPQIFLGFLLFLFGLFSSVEIITFAVGRDLVNEAHTATALGVINFTVMLGGIIFQPVVGKFLDLYWSGTISQGVRIYSAWDYRHSLIIIPIAMLISAVLAFFLKETHYAHAEKK